MKRLLNFIGHLLFATISVNARQTSDELWAKEKRRKNGVTMLETLNFLKLGVISILFTSLGACSDDNYNGPLIDSMKIT